MKRKLLSVFIAAVMMVTVLPMSVFAGNGVTNQLYWFYSGNVSVAADGKITVKNNNSDPMEKIYVDRARASSWGYFAYKSGTDYYAVNSAEVTENTGNYKLKLDGDEGDEYVYCISWAQRGKCVIKANVGQITYEMNATFELPYVGAYSSLEYTEEAYLDGEFHFSEGTKDANGNAHFYLIAPYCGYQASQLQATAVNYVNGVWKGKKIKGLDFGDVELKNLGGSNYYVSEVVVTKVFDSSSDNNWYDVGFTVSGSNKTIGIHDMRIYDSLEIEQSRQLYWFRDDEVKVSGSGELQLSVDYRESLDDAAQRSVKETSFSNTIAGYFAIKKGTNNYCAVNIGNAEVLATEIVKIEKIGEDSWQYNEYLYKIRFFKFGSASLTAQVSESEYSINLTAALPQLGLYKTETREESTYLDSEFHFVEAQKDGDGNAYFYLIANDKGYEPEMIKGYITSDGSNERTEHMDGITVGHPYKLDDEHVVCKITVSGDYREKNKYYGYRFGLLYGGQTYASDAWIHIYDSAEYPLDQQLYWFERWNVKVDEQGVITADGSSDIKELAGRKILLERLKSTNEGYFAIKDGDSYRAVKNVVSQSTENLKMVFLEKNSSEGEEVRNRYLYVVKCKAIGEYPGQFSYCEDGKEYKLSLLANLPVLGFYSAPERCAETFLNDEFHFADAEEKSSDGKTTYFYMITSDSGWDINKTKVVVRDMNSGDEVEGIYAGTVEKFTAEDDNKYLRCKIAVTLSYKQKYTGWVDISLNEDSNNWTTSIKIMDSAEYPQQQQLYWFDSWKVNAGADGLLSIDKNDYDDDLEELSDIAARVSISSDKRDNMRGYFAVKKGDNYYAINNVEVLNTDNIRIEEDEETEYRYNISWTQFGSYNLKTIYENIEYRFNIIVELPEIGFYSLPVREDGAYLDSEFHFADAKTNNESGAIFYMIGQTHGDTLDDIKVSFENGIEGIIMGEPEYMESKEYFKCPITVTKDYIYNNSNVSFECRGLNWDRRLYINIYDSTEYSQDKQLYLFDSWGIDVESDGMLKLNEERYGSNASLDEEAQRINKANSKNGNLYGYFAVKKNGNYYIVNNLTASDVENITIKTSSEDKNEYNIRWTQFGTYTLKADYEGSEYMFNLSVDLPETAFYNEPARAAENYIDGELHYIDAVSRNESGNKAYFYLIASTRGYDISDISIAIREKNDDYEWIEKTVSGISISEPRYLDDSHKYCVWTISVNKNYKGDRSNNAMRDDSGYNNRSPHDYFNFLISYKDDEGYSDNKSISVDVYDSMEIADDQSLYWFDKDYADTDDSKKIISKGYYYYAEKALFPSDRVDAALYKNGKREGWFAVKTDEDEYYAVDNVKVTDNTNVKLEYDGNKYAVKWSDFGDYRFTAVYEDKEYKQNLFLHAPDTGFFSSEEASEKTYLDGEFHFITSDNKSADGKEAYFYLIGGEGYKYYYPAFIDDNDKPVQSDGICFELLPGSTYQKQVWKVTVTSDYRTGYYSAKQIGWFSESGYLRKTEEINIYDSTEVPEEEQLYWFSDHEIRIRQDANGRLESEDENCTLDERANRILRTSYNNEAGYFAIKKGENEYYAVDSVKTEGFTVRKNKITGLYIVNRPGIGEYYCSAVDSTDGREYRMKVIFKLPDSGFYSSINEQSSDTFIVSFDYNTSAAKAFYYICSEEDFDSIGVNNINAEILKAASENGETVDGLSIGETGSIVKESNTYYYWEIKMDDSYSFNGEIRLNFSFGEYTAQSEPIKVMGPVECGDVDTSGTVDFVDALWLKRYVAKWNGYSDIYMKSADVNNDGKADEADVMILERYLAGWTGYEKLPHLTAQ